MQSQTTQQLPEKTSTSEVEPNIRAMPTALPTATIDQSTNPKDILKQLEQVSKNCKEAAKQHQQAKKEMAKLADEQKKQLKKQEQEIKKKTEELKKQQDQTDKLTLVNGQPLEKKEKFGNMQGDGSAKFLILLLLMIVAIVSAVIHLYKYRKLQREQHKKEKLTILKQ